MYAIIYTLLPLIEWLTDRKPRRRTLVLPRRQDRQPPDDDIDFGGNRFARPIIIKAKKRG